eukprot:11209854-Lingulodinium_polyedra.AAC.1
MPLHVEACIVPSDHLALLLGRDCLESAGAVADVARRQLRIGSRRADMLSSYNKHYAVVLDPSAFRAVEQALGRPELPRRLLPRAPKMAVRKEALVAAILCAAAA